MPAPLLGLRRSAALWMGTGWFTAAAAAAAAAAEDDDPEPVDRVRRNWASAEEEVPC